MGLLIAFELLQESGIHLPQAIGQSVSTIGGIVVGTAAVDAGLISPVVLIVVSIADGGYPHGNLSGVAVAFKLACALSGDPEAVLDEYADMVCLGTVADVIPLVGENRVFVSRGLKALSATKRPGLAALIRECGCDEKAISATTIGFMLAPRINAAGRMGQVELAVDLFLTQDESHAREVAAKLCELNRQRQQIESDIYSTAIAMLPEGAPPEAMPWLYFPPGPP